MKLIFLIPTFLFITQSIEALRCMVTDPVTHMNSVQEGFVGGNQAIVPFNACAVSSYCAKTRYGRKIKCNKHNTIFYVYSGRMNFKNVKGDMFICGLDGCNFNGPTHHKNNGKTIQHWGAGAERADGKPHSIKLRKNAKRVDGKVPSLKQKEIVLPLKPVAKSGANLSSKFLVPSVFCIAGTIAMLL